MSKYARRALRRQGRIRAKPQPAEVQAAPGAEPAAAPAQVETKVDLPVLVRLERRARLQSEPRPRPIIHELRRRVVGVGLLAERATSRDARETRTVLNAGTIRADQLLADLRRIDRKTA
jgi:hypothetical protein